MIFACKKKEIPSDIIVKGITSAEFEILQSNSGFKTIWTFQPTFYQPNLTNGIIIKDYTMNELNGKLHLLVSVLNKSSFTPLSCQKVTADLVNNTEIIEKDFTTQNTNLGSNEAKTQFQPYSNNIFWWYNENSSVLYKNDLTNSQDLGTLFKFNNIRIQKNGKISTYIKKIIPNNPPSSYSGSSYLESKTNLFDKNNSYQGIGTTFIEEINDTLNYFIASTARNEFYVIDEINGLKLYKSSLRVKNGVEVGSCKLLNKIDLDINLYEKGFKYKVHYTADPNIVVIGLLVKKLNELESQFYSFIFNKQTEKITQVLNKIEAKTNSILDYAVFDLDNNGNIYYSSAEYNGLAGNAIFKATPSGVNQIGIPYFYKNSLPDGISYISNIKVFNNIPYIALVYSNTIGKDNIKEKNYNSQLSIVVPN